MGDKCRGWVLVTNDDGIRAPGLRAITQKVRELNYRPLVVAPEKNQSAKGQSLKADGYLFLKKYTDDSYSVSGTPVDCVRLALQLPFFADKPFKFVVSGINNGLNIGDDFLFSGTLGAAAHAARLGLPAIALSQGVGSEGTAFVVEGELMSFPALPVFERFMSDNTVSSMPPGTFISINVPAGATGHETLEWARLGARDWSTGVPEIESHVGDGVYRVTPWATDPQHLGEGDFLLLEAGKPTASLIKIADGGAYDALQPGMRSAIGAEMK